MLPQSRPVASGRRKLRWKHENQRVKFFCKIFGQTRETHGIAATNNALTRGPGGMHRTQSQVSENRRGTDQIITGFFDDALHVTASRTVQRSPRGDDRCRRANDDRTPAFVPTPAIVAQPNRAMHEQHFRRPDYDHLQLGFLLGRVLINRDRWHSLIDVRSAPKSGGKADMLGGPSRARSGSLIGQFCLRSRSESTSSANAGEGWRRLG